VEVNEEGGAVVRVVNSSIHDLEWRVQHVIEVDRDVVFRPVGAFGVSAQMTEDRVRAGSRESWRLVRYPEAEGQELKWKWAAGSMLTGSCWWKRWHLQMAVSSVHPTIPL